MEPTQPINATINYDDFAKLDLRVATVLECRPHGNADKLLVLQIELANASGGRSAPGCGSTTSLSSWWASRSSWSRT